MALIVETGEIVPDANSWVAEADFETWLAANQYAVSGPAETLLMQAYLYLSTLPWLIAHQCEYVVHPDFKQAQMHLALMIDRGDFAPLDQLEDKTLISKGLGRGAITKGWKPREDLQGYSLIQILRRFPAIYMFLQRHVIDSGYMPLELWR